MIRDDWLLRQLTQAMEAVARAFLHQAAADRDSAEADIEEAYSGLLEHNRPMLDTIDVATLARLVGSPEKVRALARVSHADAQLREGWGDLHGAAICAERAIALATWAHGESPHADDEELLALVGAR